MYCTVLYKRNYPATAAFRIKDTSKNINNQSIAGIMTSLPAVVSSNGKPFSLVGKKLIGFPDLSSDALVSGS